MTAHDDFLAKHAASFERDPLFGCWKWVGRLDKRDGYGVIWSHNKATAAYVAFYRALVGPVPPGLVLDHVCRRRECVRPAHLEPVKGSENDLRRSWRYRSRRTTCRNGHSLATCITTPEGGRLCRRSDCQGAEADFFGIPATREADGTLVVATPADARSFREGMMLMPSLDKGPRFKP